MLLHIPTIDDPTERFLSVVKFYLSGWHIRPPSVYHLRAAPDKRTRLLTIHQGRQEAAEPHPRRDLHMLLGPCGPAQGLLHLRADLAPPAQVELLLHGAAPPHPHRRDAQAAEQIPRKLGGQSDGGYCLPQPAEPGEGSQQGGAIVSRSRICRNSVSSGLLRGREVLY
jgi:hypothetical protein